MKLAIITTLLLGSILSGWTPEEQLKARSNGTSSHMSEIEKDVLYYINLARINPSKFEKEVLNPHLKKGNKYTKSYVRSLKKDLKNTSPLPALKYTEKLFDFAKHHARTTGRIGKTGHRSVTFKSYSNRTKKLLKYYTSVGENIQYGYNNAEHIVLDLLIDDGIKGVGHRKNILNKKFKHVGISIQPHKKYTYNCVIEFGGTLQK